MSSLSPSQLILITYHGPQKPASPTKLLSPIAAPSSYHHPTPLSERPLPRLPSASQDTLFAAAVPCHPLRESGWTMLGTTSKSTTQRRMGRRRLGWPVMDYRGPLTSWNVPRPRDNKRFGDRWPACSGDDHRRQATSSVVYSPPQTYIPWTGERSVVVVAGW